MITEKELKKVAELAKLDVKEEDIPRITRELSHIMEYVETIRELDLDGIKPTAHVIQVQNVFREDEVQKNSIIQKVMKDAPEGDGEFFKVPKVL